MVYLFCSDDLFHNIELNSLHGSMQNHTCYKQIDQV